MGGRVLAIGDIHGHAELLDALLRAVVPSAGDVVVTLGDYVDRGPDSCGVLNLLVRLAQAGRLVALRGNHEQMMMEARASETSYAEWMLNGGEQTLASYSPFDDPGRLADVPDEHWDFLERVCVDWHETATHFFVHAGAYADLPLGEQPTFKLRWDFFDDPPPHESGKIMVCGHTSQRSGKPRNIGHAVCIDTGVYRGGPLTCLDTTSGRLWQAHHDGSVRQSWLEE